MKADVTEFRIEKDSMGEVKVPAQALYGPQTQRAVENFPISGQPMPAAFIHALGFVKQAAARVNADLGLLEQAMAKAIEQAAAEVAAGRWDAEFPIDVFQTGSGTSTNMNANEVIANRAAEILGRRVHPNDQVNLGESSNDVIPSVLHVSAVIEIERDLLPALEHLRAALAEKAKVWDHVIKTGRTHLMDATPIRLGQEFGGYASQVEHSIARVRAVLPDLRELAIGGTAVGTGLNTHPEFGRRMADEIGRLAGTTFVEAANHFEAQGAQDGAAWASGALNTVAASLMKIANDVRLMNSGPRCGLAEITLPAIQPGSSIMPGKVNPVICEAVIQVGAQVMGNHQAVTLGGQWGYFELNTMMPLIAHNLLQSIDLLAAATKNFADQCVTGLQATEHGPEKVEQGLAICTSLVPEIGYLAAADIAKEAYKTGETVRQVAKRKTNLSDADLERILDPEAMTRPGLTGAPSGG